MDAREQSRFETVEAPRLRIRTPSGRVSIETADSAETIVELEALRPDEVTRTAIAQATVEQRGSEIVVELAKQGWGFLGRSPEVGIRIRCPYGSALDCITASADVEATGRLGETTVEDGVRGHRAAARRRFRTRRHRERRRPGRRARRRRTAEDGFRRRLDRRRARRSLGHPRLGRPPRRRGSRRPPGEHGLRRPADSLDPPG